ncbi:kettin homolog, partial [Saccostrea cucullata]|uniref:kettin homolog n=1 Tax=Saccostrea cuccullata TaxID=36930 RepID=UPI002ED336AE
MSGGTEFQLKVRQCQKEDKGVYTVMAENLYGTDDRLISLRVEPVPSRVDTPSLRDSEGRGNLTKTHGTQYHRKDNQTIREAKLIRREDRPEHTMKPRRKRLKQTLGDGASSVDGEICNVHCGMYDDNFNLCPRVIQAGHSLKVVSCVPDVPIPKVTWTKDGHDITQSDYYLCTYSSGVCTMEVPCAHVSDTGIYTCIAISEVDLEKTSSYIQVE